MRVLTKQLWKPHGVLLTDPRSILVVITAIGLLDVIDVWDLIGSEQIKREF